MRQNNHERIQCRYFYILVRNKLSYASEFASQNLVKYVPEAIVKKSVCIRFSAPSS